MPTTSIYGYDYDHWQHYTGRTGRRTMSLSAPHYLTSSSHGRRAPRSSTRKTILYVCQHVLCQLALCMDCVIYSNDFVLVMISLLLLSMNVVFSSFFPSPIHIDSIVSFFHRCRRSRGSPKRKSTARRRLCWWGMGESGPRWVMLCGIMTMYAYP